MFLRINTFNYASKMQSDAARALIKYEIMDKLDGIVSLEVLDVSDSHFIGVFRYDNKESADKGSKVYVENLKK